MLDSNDVKSDALDESAESGVYFADGRWVRFPNVVALDPRVGADALVFLAYRATWADSRRPFRTTPSLMRRLGFGREKLRKAVNQAKAAGYLKRWQPHNRARGEKAAQAVEILTLPPLDSIAREYRIVRRSWFDPNSRDITSRSPPRKPVSRINALAAVLYMNANGGRVLERELSARFGWSRPTASAVLAALTHTGIVEKQEIRTALGRIKTVNYATVKKLDDGLLGNGILDSLRTGLLDEALSEQFLDAANASYASRGDAPTALDDLWNQAVSSRVLLGWLDDGREPYADEMTPELHEDMGAMLAVADDQTLRQHIAQATDGRVMPAVYSEAGLYAVRMLALWMRQTAVLQYGEHLTAAEALAQVLSAMSDRIGRQTGERLNSLALIGRRLGWADYHGSGQVEVGRYYASAGTPPAFTATSPAGHDDADDGLGVLLADLKRRDLNGVIAVGVWRERVGLHRLIASYGIAAVAEVVSSTLHGSLIDGRRAASIKTWAYFIDALDDHKRFAEMARNGERPGDIFGMHRRSGKGG